MRKDESKRRAKGLQSKRPWIVRSRAWIGILIIAPFALASAFSRPLVREGTATDFVLDLIGWSCFASGALYRWWATLYLGGRKSQELTVEGPYSTCRNPLYFGTFLLTLSIAFYLHSFIFAVGVAFATPIYLGITVPWEEKVLRNKFGQRFDRYQRETSKFFPDFSSIRAPLTVLVNVDGLKAELRRTLQWMWIPVLAQSLVHLQTETWWPIWVHLP